MDARTLSIAWIIVLGLVVPPLHAQNRVIPLTVDEGQCSCHLPALSSTEKYFLVVASLAQAGGPFLVEVATQPETTATPRIQSVSFALLSPRGKGVGDLAPLSPRGRGVGGEGADPATIPVPLTKPQQLRLFHIFIGTNNFNDRRAYVPVCARLYETGRHCQVYLDSECVHSPAIESTIADAIQTFDDQVFPTTARLLGQSMDIDGDGRFTILFTPWLSRLQAGKVALGGFVRCSDFDTTQAAPFGNRCDMMYLNTALRKGPHLHSLLAHEYTHAVVHCERCRHQAGQATMEDAWLNEALAHWSELEHGFGRTNLDHRIRAFLDTPNRYQLVVPDYYQANIWRSAGHRGAALLFLHHCIRHGGPHVAQRLVRTHLHGTANLEAATGVTFAELFRQWTVSLLCQPQEACRYGPRLVKLGANGVRQLELAGTSAAYLRVEAAIVPARLTVTAAPEAQLQVTLCVRPASSVP